LKPLPVNYTTPKVNVNVHGVEVGAGLGGESLAANVACIENELFLGAMLENWLDANWTIEIHDLLKKRGMFFNSSYPSMILKKQGAPILHAITIGISSITQSQRYCYLTKMFFNSSSVIEWGILKSKCY
jgi:hypothetical protein